MKKLFNLLFVFIISFVFVILRVGAIPEACDAKINTETYYNESGWDTYVYVCNSQFTGRYAFSTCDVDRQAAKDYCEGTYSQSQYKGSYQTAETGECSEEKIESCFECTVECYKPTGTYYSCSAGDSGASPVKDAAGKITGYQCPSYSWQEAGPITYSNDTDPLGPDDKGTYEEKIKEQCGGYQSRNAKCEDQYRAKVPIYKCVQPPKKHHVKNMREAKYTVKTKYGTTIPAYCINPDDNAPETLSGNNSMTYDIDATECASSFATTDCGYANILIEGYYRGTLKGNSKYTYAVIGDAMRLWGAHWGAGGYEDTGIADEDDSTISDPNKWLKFVPKDTSGEYLNVFKETVSAVMKQELYRPGTDDIYDVKTDFDSTLNLQQIACSSSRMGLFCGQGSKDGYLYAIALFANTVQGNKYMQQHLNEINAHLYGDEIFVNANPEGAVFEIVDENTVEITYPLKEGVEISCSTLEEGKYNPEDCRMEQKIIIKTASGQILEERDYYDYCEKNYCKIKIDTDWVITCDILEGVKIYTKNIKKCGSESVKKYVSCGSTDDQIMFSFEPDQTCGEIPEYEEVPWIDINCSGCPDEPSATTPNCDLEDTSGDYVSREVADPSLNCILHKNLSGGESSTSSKKAYYDYSKMFGVNTNFCKVYCSDKVTYYMEGRKDVYNALQLKYDIESKVFPSRPESERSNHSLTSIIKVQRDCVSEIYYDKINFAVMDQVGKDYGLSADINDWKQLYEALREKSMTENNRQEVLNQLIYDLYACNFFSDSQISSKTGNKVKKPRDSKNPLSIANTILTNTKNYCNNNDCVTGKIKYEGGAEYISGNDPRYTGMNWIDPALSTEESVYNGLNLRYCSKDNCFRGSINGQYKEDYSQAGTSKFNATVKFDGTNVTIPTNDYAIFTYTVEADLYNSTRYQVEPYSGKVKVVEENAYDDKLQTLNKYLYPINKSVNGICDRYDGDKFMCDVDYDISVPIITKYNSLLNAEKDQIGTIAFRRNYNSYNDLITKLQTADSRRYSCAYVVKTNGEADKGFVFRNIDLNNPVPVERDGTKLDNSNWDVNNPSDPEYSNFISGVINEIKISGAEDLYATDEYLEYSYELTPDAIRSIRNHNLNSEYFEDIIPGSCTMSNGKNFNCRSTFLEDLHAGRFGVTLKKIDGKSKYNVCKDNPSEEGCVE